eukprot:1012716-Amphidinium_carterae.1
MKLHEQHCALGVWRLRMYEFSLTYTTGLLVVWKSLISVRLLASWRYMETLQLSGLSTIARAWRTTLDCHHNPPRWHDAHNTSAIWTRATRLTANS